VVQGRRRRQAELSLLTSLGRAFTNLVLKVQISFCKCSSVHASIQYPLGNFDRLVHSRAALGRPIRSSSGHRGARQPFRRCDAQIGSAIEGHCASVRTTRYVAGHRPGQHQRTRRSAQRISFSDAIPNTVRKAVLRRPDTAVQGAQIVDIDARPLTAPQPRAPRRACAPRRARAPRSDRGRRIAAST